MHGEENMAVTEPSLLFYFIYYRGVDPFFGWGGGGGGGGWGGGQD